MSSYPPLPTSDRGGKGDDMATPYLADGIDPEDYRRPIARRFPEYAGPWDEDVAPDLDPCSDCGAGAGEACRAGCIVPHLAACKPCRDLRPCEVGVALMEAA